MIHDYFWWPVIGRAAAICFKCGSLSDFLKVVPARRTYVNEIYLCSSKSCRHIELVR